MAILIKFTGKRIEILGRDIPATCIVRNEVNGWRSPGEVVRTYGSTRPHGLPYQPRPFPMGMHRITRVEVMPDSSVYWPFYIDTDASQLVEVWELDEDGDYQKPSGRTVNGKGYGIHHARVKRNGELFPSNTTLGCINIKDPSDALWLGRKLRSLMREGANLRLWVPAWTHWETP